MSDVEPVNLPGRVLLPDGRECDCKLLCGDPDTMQISLDVAVSPGATVLCHVPGLGVVAGSIGQALPAGYRLHVLAGALHRARLGARIAWHRRMAAGRFDQRAHDRIVPLSTDVQVRSSSGTAVPARIIDLSATGAALQLPDRPAIGAPVVVGRRRATVVRHLDDGVAVAFALPLRPQDVVPETVL